ncbi:Rsd/AlgQ family anti-sigma factor [Agarivorans gilvus]|uniref:Sigma D regulator n=1 Tax=Agarivorans gilvus TaxID=680279 RepID=A0ABQ1I502_9ALTE|nr:Rsd/AlgQ family anti-sigma factor [Agarivorans gilvus]GGB17414.1 sigma D regulator [Agarivorans gilvus]
MLRKVEQAQAKWGGASQVIDAWLSARKKLLIAYCELAGLPPYDKLDRSLPDASKISQFCEQLVDYVSTGHFEIYEQIVNECANDGDTTPGERLLPLITETTDIALSFNDSYAEVDENIELNSFDRDLSQLGQEMEERFEVEDELLDHLYQHSQQQAAAE